MSNKRTSFPPVFWIANSVEVLERFAYYGIYLGFGIYFEMLGFRTDQLGIIQSIFLFVSYTVPVFSGTFADRYGFKKVLLISYLAYLPSILLLIVTRSFTGIALTMLCIGFAAGIFKPLISGTVRVVTDSTNRSLGFGIFYAMVNIGASFGPLILGRLRAISWQNAYIAAAMAIGVMFIITLIFYKEPKRNFSGETLAKKFRDMGEALSNIKFTIFLILLGLFFWLPFWSFFNLLPKFVENYLDGHELYMDIKSVLGTSFANFLSKEENGVRRILGETISHTGYLIVLFQVFISWIFEKFRPISSFLTGLLIFSIGFVLLAVSGIADPLWLFPGIMFIAFGEMISSPRIQEYITWIAPKEKAGLYMGSNFLAVGIGGLLSGLVYTSGIHRYFEQKGNPEYTWIVLAIHMLAGIAAIWLFSRIAGLFKEQEV
ncbi:MAG TPA: MFS transporter [Bacteroidales bacterium]|jgi:dipeptide/tripeptide permease|nr:MFS transporter [Bacteroidales bacterium]